MIYTDNLERVSSTKRDQILSCIRVAEQCGKVARMIVFGSSVTDHCAESSDVDLCIEVNGSSRGREMYELTRDLSWACNHHCDILKYNKLSPEFKREIDRKGVVVYELS